MKIKTKKNAYTKIFLKRCFIMYNFTEVFKQPSFKIYSRKKIFKIVREEKVSLERWRQRQRAFLTAPWRNERLLLA